MITKPDRKNPPQSQTFREFQFPKVRKEVLDNGCPLYILNGGTQDVLKLDVMVDAGSVFSNQRLVAPFAGLMLHEGTVTKTAHQIAESFDFYGAYFQPTTEKDKSFVGLISLNKYIEQTLPLYSEVLTESSFPGKEFDLLIERRRQGFLVELEKTSFLAREAFYEKLFGPTHPYGMIVREELYHNLKRDSVFHFYQQQYHSGNFVFIVSGNVTNRAIEMINRYLGQKTRITGSQPQTLEINKQTQTEPYIIEKKSAVQSSIRSGLLTVNKQHPDYCGLKILCTIFGGYFGSRLMKNIREEKGYTYGINAMQVSLLQAGFLAVAADVKAENTRDALSEIVAEIEKLKSEPVPMHELELVRNYMMGELLQMFDGPFATADTFKAVLPYGKDFGYFEQLIETLWTITPEELMTLANKYLLTDKLITVVAGKY